MDWNPHGKINSIELFPVISKDDDEQGKYQIKIQREMNYYVANFIKKIYDWFILLIQH